MASSIAACMVLWSGASARAQAPDSPPINQPPVPGEYRMLRGQTLQLKKPANSSEVQEPAPLPAMAPAMSFPREPVPAQPVRYAPQEPAPAPAQPVPKDALQSKDPVAKDPPAKDPNPSKPGEEGRTGSGSGSQYKPKTTLPTREERYRLDSAKALQGRIQRETGQSEGFPAQPDFTYDGVPTLYKIPLVYEARAFAPSRIVTEANFVCYGKLLFEEKNAERYGWDLGYIQTAVSLGYFFKDVLTVPAKLANGPFCQECTPKCLPGDQVPYKFYREPVTASGILAEAGSLAALIVIFP